MCCESSQRVCQRFSIQVENDGNSCGRPNLHLWWQPVRASQHHYAQIHAEEEDTKYSVSLVMNGGMHTSALMRIFLTCWPSLYPQGRIVGNLYGCYSTIWYHRVCDGVTLTVSQSAPFRGVLPLTSTGWKEFRARFCCSLFLFVLVSPAKSFF